MCVAKPVAGAPLVLIEAAATARTLRFCNPVELLCAYALDEIDGVLARLAEAQHAGFHLAGYCAYEAGYGFEPRLRGLAPRPQGPLLCFGVFGEPDAFDWADVKEDGFLDRLEPSWSSQEYEQRFDRVIDYIRAGDAYQVNLTFPLRGRWRGDPISLYAALRRQQPAPFGAFVALGEEIILSFSPELFFEVAGREIRVRPMKGTAPRGRDPEEDDRLAHLLATNPKDRAENLMIVDLLRNDLKSHRRARLGQGHRSLHDRALRHGPANDVGRGSAFAG